MTCNISEMTCVSETFSQIAMTCNVNETLSQVPQISKEWSTWDNVLSCFMAYVVLVFLVFFFLHIAFFLMVLMDTIIVLNDIVAQGHDLNGLSLFQKYKRAFRSQQFKNDFDQLFGNHYLCMCDFIICPERTFININVKTVRWGKTLISKAYRSVLDFATDGRLVWTVFCIVLFMVDVWFVFDIDVPQGPFLEGLDIFENVLNLCELKFWQGLIYFVTPYPLFLLFIPNWSNQSS